MDWNVLPYSEDFHFVQRNGEQLLEQLPKRKGQKVLDIGCGTGELTNRMHEMGLDVVGIDFSNAMLNMAKKKYPHLSLYIKDASKFTMFDSYDVVFSNAVFHWIENQEGLIHSIVDVLKLGGTLLCEFGGSKNTECIHKVLGKVFSLIGHKYRHSFYFPTVEDYCNRLESHGLQVVEANYFDVPVRLNKQEDIRKWLYRYHMKALQVLEETVQKEVVEDAIKRLKPILYRDSCWYIDYTRIRIRAKKLGEY